jgi:hypothetical protein
MSKIENHSAFFENIGPFHNLAYFVGQPILLVCNSTATIKLVMNQNLIF